MPKCQNPYLEWELKIIRDIYPTEGPNGCIAAGICRSRASIITKANTMGVTMDLSIKSKLQYAGMAAGKEKREEPVLPDEYIQACDIFQVGYRVALNTGTLHQFMGRT